MNGAQMAYIPDEWIQCKRKIPPSARDLLFYYCARADQDTGSTTVSSERTSRDLGIRKDHVDEYDRKLVREGLISVEKSPEGRSITLKDAWQPRSSRNGLKSSQPKAIKDTSQVLVKTPQNLGKSPQNSGNPPETWEDLPKTWVESPQNLGLHIRNNQPMEPAHGTSQRSESPSESEKPILSPPSVSDIQQVTRLIVDATGEMPVNGRKLKIEQTAIQVCQAAGSGSVTAMTDYIADQGDKVIKLNFLGPDFCSWYAARRRTRQAGNGPPGGSFANRFCPACKGAGQRPRIVDRQISGFDTCGECNGTGKPTRQAATR